MDKAKEAVASTGLLVAAIRAMESTRDDRLFTDPFADKLAGETGRELLAAAIAEAGERSTVQIVVRTRFLDDALLRAVRGAKQVVILAAGMDARAYRLAWPDGTTVYELDQPAVIAAKADLLADDQPRCRRVAIGVDLADDWPTALMAAGFDPQTPTVWLIEGLLQYLDESAVRTLFDRVNTLVGAQIDAAVRRRRQDAAGVADDGAASAVHGRAGFPLAVRHRRTGGAGRAPRLVGDGHRHRASRATSGTGGSHPRHPWTCPTCRAVISSRRPCPSRPCVTVAHARGAIDTPGSDRRRRRCA